MRNRTLPLTAAVVTALLAGGNALAKRPENPGKPDRASFGKARAPLVRSDEGPEDSRAKGRIDVMRRRNGSDFRVKAQRLDPGQMVDVVLERLGDDPATLGVAETDFVIATEVLADGQSANGDGGFQVKLRTHRNDTLPFDAASLDEFAGHRVRVRADSAANDGPTLLLGVVPLIGADLPRRADDRADLVVVDEGDTCRGRVRLRFRGKDVRSELRIDVRGLAEGVPVSFRMDDGTGAMLEIGTDTANADGDARYRVRTLHGELLPFGAMTVLDLRGRALEVWVDPMLVDLTPEVPDDPQQETGLCLTGTVPGSAD